MSDYDEPYETERSEDEEEEEERFEDRSHKDRLIQAKKWIKDAVVINRNRMLDQGVTKRAKLTEEDVDQFFDTFPDLTVDGIENTPTMLHAIYDLVQFDDEVDIESVTVKALVQRLVEQLPRLLYISNDEQQNPLYLAITKKKKILADYMVVSCPKEESSRKCLARALEDSRSNEKRKNCLHLAFEMEMKPTTLLRMLQDASITALKAVDATGRRPMHYAVQYRHCNVEVIRAFINRDSEIVNSQKRLSPGQPPKSFLDMDKETKTSVYQEHVSSARVYNEERDLKKGSADNKKRDDRSAAIEDLGTHACGNRDDAARGRHFPSQSKYESGNRLANSSVTRDTRNMQDGSERYKDRERDKRKDGDDKLRPRLGEKTRELLRRQSAEFRHEELERPLAAGKLSRDRQGLGAAGTRQSLRAQPSFPSTDMAKPNSDVVANTPKMLRRVPTNHGEIVAERPDRRGKELVMANKKPRKLIDHEVAGRNSKAVLWMLKLHYMRTRSIERATLWLYNTNPKDIQTFFDYQKLPDKIKVDLFEKAFVGATFDEVLKFVHFSNVTVIHPTTPRTKNQLARCGLGRRDMEFFFNFLFKKGVRYILKVVVEEDGPLVHSDEAIKNSLNKITVEHLDWRKVDLDPQLICGISTQADYSTFEGPECDRGSKNQLRTLDLRWSGNNAVLRAWSEPEGLPSLQHLRTVNIVVPEGTVLYDSPEWIEVKKKEFEERLNKYCAAVTSEQEIEQSSLNPDHRKISVHLHGVTSATKKSTGGSLQSESTQGRTPQIVPERVINTHEWLKCMDEFAKNINPLWTSTRASFLSSAGVANLGHNEEGIQRPATLTGLENEVVVALIDDGVALLDQNFVGRVLEGKTFDYQDGSVGQSYNSDRGHGTEMARCILRVCPMAKIYPIRLKTHASDEGKNQIDLDSAASAIYAALEKDAAIISMSWTIPVPKTPDPAKTRFEAAVREACKRNKIMFCTSGDGGHFISNDYPSAAQRDKIFRIGAAHDNGKAFSFAGTDVDFSFPGVKVNVNATSVATGSSVATALAAGMAATIIFCFKISALAVKRQTQTMGYRDTYGLSFSESQVQKISEYADMKAAFGHIGWINEARFIQVWDTFQPVTTKLESINTDDDTKIRCVIGLCTKLMTHQVGLTNEPHYASGTL